MGRQVELHVHYPVDARRPLAMVVRTLIGDFHRSHPDIRVTVIFSDGYGETVTRVRAALAVGEPADITVLYSGTLRALGTQMAVPLDSLISAMGGAVFLTDFLPGVMMNARVHDQLYGLPFQKSTYLLYYNRSAFSVAGLDPDAPPQTWQDLAAVAKRLTIRKGDHVERWGLELPEAGLPAIFQSFIYQQGSLVYEATGARIYLTTPEARRALTFLAELSQRDQVMPAEPPPWYDVPLHFNEQRTAMMIHSTSVLPTVRDGAPFPFGVAFIPHGGRPGAVLAGGELCLLPVPDERQGAAWTLMTWLTEPSQQARWCVDSGYLAVRRSAWDLEPLVSYARRFSQVAVARDQLAHGAPELMTPAVEEVRAAMHNAILDAIAGRRPVDTALGQAQTAVDEAIGRAMNGANR